MLPGFDPTTAEQAALLTQHKDTVVGNFALLTYAAALEGNFLTLGFNMKCH